MRSLILASLLACGSAVLPFPDMGPMQGHRVPKYLMPELPGVTMHWSAADYDGTTLRPKVGTTLTTVGTVPTGAGLAPYAQSVGPTSDTNYIRTTSGNDEGDTTGDFVMAFAFIANSAPSVLASDGSNGANGWYVQSSGFRQQPSNNGAVGGLAMVGAANVFCMRRVGSTAYFSTNGAAEVSAAMGTVTQDTTNAMFFGRYGAAGGFSSAVRFLEFQFARGTFSSGTCASLYSAIQSAVGQKRVAFIGDSLIAGFTGVATVATPMPAGVQALATNGKLISENDGVSGYTTSQILTACTGLLGRGITHLVIEGGRNDIGSGTVGSGATAFSNLKTCADQHRTLGVHITWITVLPSSLTGQAKTEQLDENSRIRAEAASQGDQIEDAYVDLADPGDSNALRAAWNSDNTHMNQTGYTAWAAFVFPKIQ